MAQNQVKSAQIKPGRRAYLHGIIEEIDIRQKFALFEIRTFSTPFSPKQLFENSYLDSVRMSASAISSRGVVTR